MELSHSSNQTCALISVSDKSEICTFASLLTDLGFRLLSTGGTATTLIEAGLDVTEVSDLTGFPEIMDGRVKTLHPKIHGGLLGRRETDRDTMARLDIPAIDILILNLYPFEKTVAAADVTLQQAVEDIDIGGPAMLRSAAKNFAHVAVVTDPAQYDWVATQLREHNGRLPDDVRFSLAVQAFNHIARYDNAISNYFSSLANDGEKARFPGQANGSVIKITDLRYGENPHQQAAWYRDQEPAAGSLAAAVQHQGKELSFNNIADADAAWQCIQQFVSPACVIVKHANPCGVAVAGDIEQAYQRAYETDSTSAFGGIIAFNQPLDETTSRQVINQQFVELIMAPGFSPAALNALADRKNLRLLEMPPGPSGNRFDLKRVAGGLLIQTADQLNIERTDCKVVSQAQPEEQQWADVMFAWKVVKSVKSNAIVYAAGQRTLGIGAGQMSRVDSARIAGWKAVAAGFDLSGSSMASDAFFPFRDSIDNAAENGIKNIIQPGGSMRDEEVIAAADEHGMAMIFTGVRHFRH